MAKEATTACCSGGSGLSVPARNSASVRVPAAQRGRRGQQAGLGGGSGGECPGPGWRTALGAACQESRQLLALVPTHPGWVMQLMEPLVASTSAAAGVHQCDWLPRRRILRSRNRRCVVWSASTCEDPAAAEVPSHQRLHQLHHPAAAICSPPGTLATRPPRTQGQQEEVSYNAQVLQDGHLLQRMMQRVGRESHRTVGMTRAAAAVRAMPWGCCLECGCSARLRKAFFEGAGASV